MKKNWLIAVFVLICAHSFGQDEAYLIPRVVYVGDIALLVLPLPRLGAREDNDVVLTSGSPGFPSDPDIDFHRIILERRISGSRLVIEFSAFQSGTLELPPMEIGGELFSGLIAEIRSVIADSGSGLELSPPATALTMPGTAALIYGTLAALAAALILSFWILLRGRRYLHTWAVKWKRRRLIASMKIMVRRLHKAVLKGKKIRDILDILSGEFRGFLSHISGENCRAMTARELELLQVCGLAGCLMGKIFHRCDELRFAPNAAGANDAHAVLADVRAVLDALEKVEKGKAA
ncbi:MAG: hypothetical protein FWG99_08675 [Treponema sp.]|nr:hypothetical protein [Treponema sp.]